MIATIASALITLSTAQIESQRAPTIDSGTYRLIWDDEIDLNLKSNKNCDIKISVSNSKLDGSFLRLSNGRTAKLKGPIEYANNCSMVSFLQEEEGGYVCAYQILMRPQPTIHMLGQEAPPVYLGVWQDSLGRGGDFVLYKYQ